MRVLFDQGTPVPLRKHLPAHHITTTFELGWNNLKNGELLKKSEESGFSVLVTTDQNLRYQQNLTGRKITIVVLLTTSWRASNERWNAWQRPLIPLCQAVMSRFLSRNSSS